MILNDDIKSCIDDVPGIDLLKDKNIFITGANGLICSVIIESLLMLNDIHDFHIKVYAACRNVVKFKKRFSYYLNRNDLVYIHYEALEIDNKSIPDGIDYIIHGAGNASPQKYMSEPVETMLANIYGINNILKHVSQSKQKCRVLYISSSEIYGKKLNNLPYKENENGSVDIAKVRACYPTSKRAAESLCVSYFNEYSTDVVIVRPGHIYGPTINDSDQRVSSEIPRDILQGKDIILKSTGNQIRSYCYVVDCAMAILTALVKGVKGEAYNISNPNSIVSIKEMAEEFAGAGNAKIVLKKSCDIKNDEKKANFMCNSSLSSTKIEKLGWKARFNMKDGALHTIMAMKEIEQND